MKLSWPTEYTRYVSHVPTEEYREGWDRIFGKKKTPEEEDQPKQDQPKESKE
jgi:hypothetical protein